MSTICIYLMLAFKINIVHYMRSWAFFYRIWIVWYGQKYSRFKLMNMRISLTSWKISDWWLLEWILFLIWGWPLKFLSFSNHQQLFWKPTWNDASQEFYPSWKIKSQRQKMSSVWLLKTNFSNHQFESKNWQRRNYQNFRGSSHDRRLRINQLRRQRI